MKLKHYILIMCLLVLSGGVAWFFFRKDKKGFKKRLVDIAKKELEKWRDYKELSPFVSDVLVSYWKSVDKLFSNNDMQNSSIHASYPWSSAFISYLFQKAGAGGKFPYSAAHSGYFQVAKSYRDDSSASLRGFRITEYAPKVGDLVVYSRESGKGYDTHGHFASHGELVIKVGNGFIETVGGNVGDSVKKSRFKTDSKGYLSNNSQALFMVIENNIK